MPLNIHKIIVPSGVNKNTRTMGRITELLDSFDVSEKKVDLSKLYGIFESVEDIPIQIFFFEPGLGLARVRINKKGELFQNISELSYNPHVSEYGRANLRKKWH